MIHYSDALFPVFGAVDAARLRDAEQIAAQLTELFVRLPVTTDTDAAAAAAQQSMVISFCSSHCLVFE